MGHLLRARVSRAERGAPTGSHANTDLARRHGKRACLGIVVTSNERMLRAIGKLGGRKVGRVGYLQIGTFRLHYLVGREAFRDTISRIFVERVWI